MRPFPFFAVLSLAALFSSISAFAQRPQPTHRDLAYDDDHAAQVLDVYLPSSDKPVPAMIFIHGGGWRAGTKNNIPGFLARAVSEGWLAVVSVEYRFTDVEVHPAQVNDCIRAVQFVRSRAAEWKIDPLRLGVTGGSAGGHLSLWVALHDDMADLKSDDPVARESSRVSCAVDFAGPTDWSLLSEIDHAHPAYRQLLGYEPGTPANEMDASKKESVSPITYASADDPPILIVHGDADTIVPVEHARDLDERLKEVGGDSELLIVAGGEHNVAGAGGEEVAVQVTAFIKEHLLKERESQRKVAIVVGPEKHAPGTHEVAAGGRLMTWCLNHDNVDQVDAEVFYQWPADAAYLEKVDAVVFIGDQFPGERLEESERIMSDLAAMTARGCGVVCIHYATGLAAGDVAEDGDHPLLHWTGGYFATRCNHHQSMARIFEATVTPAAPEAHPIRRGWETFQVTDEPYTRNWFGKDGLVEGAIPLATVAFPPDDPQTEIVAWAIERKDGGRGAGITMPHFYRNWERVELRRFVLNSIVWAAGGNVPMGGVATEIPDIATFEPVSVDPMPKKDPAK